MSEGSGNNDAPAAKTRSGRSFDHPEYKLRKKLGQGGMATVYLATQVKLRRAVAIKIMSTRMTQNEGLRKRFVREAQTLARFSHPNIITIYEVEYYGDRPFLVMEYLDGGDLKERMGQGMSRGEILACMRQVSSALEYAHERNYVHRDIKPENCMFDSDGRLVLTDFGIARSADNEGTQLTQMGVSIGTPAYMAPEQFETSSVDARADLYSLGVMLFELLSGERPFQANSAAAMLFRHASEPVPQLPDDVSDLQPLVEWLMAKSPDDRPQSIADVITKLDELLANNDDALESIVVRQQQSRARDAELRAMAASQHGRRASDRVEDTGATVIRGEEPEPEPSTNRMPLFLAGAAVLVLAVAAAGYLLLPDSPQEPVAVPDVAVAPADPEPVAAPPEPVEPEVPQPAPVRKFVAQDETGIVAEISSTDDIGYAYDSLVALDYADIEDSVVVEGWQFFIDVHGELHASSPLFAEAVERVDGWREVEEYDKAATERELTAMDYYYRGYGYQMARRYEAAIADYERSLELDPANTFVEEFIRQSE